MERDRETTEKRLLATIGQMIAEQGFEKIGINAVASRSKTSKILIYRYFGSLEGLIAEYIRRHDFWLNYSFELAENEPVVEAAKRIFRQQIRHLRENPTLRRLYRWELSCHNDTIARLREQRERIGLELIRRISTLLVIPEKDVAAASTIITAAITYLVMLEDFCPVYNGIEINTDKGWEELGNSIDNILEKISVNNNIK